MRQDILLNTDGDLDIADGDLVVGESDNQHVKAILNAYPGHYRQWPFLGADLLSTLLGATPGQLVSYRSQAARHLASDGYKLETMNETQLQYSLLTDGS